MNIAHLIALWLTYANDRSDANALPGEPPLNLDHSYILDYKILNEYHGTTFFIERNVYLIRCYVVDELISFDLLAVYSNNQLLEFLSTEIDTTWHTVYTNEGN